MGLWLGLAGAGGACLLALLWRRQLARAVEARTRALREEQKQLDTIITHVDAYLYIKDVQFRYTFVSRKVCELFNLPPEAILGKMDSALFPGETHLELMATDRGVLERGETSAREVVLPGADGIRRTFWAVKVPLRDERGAIVGLCGASTDISDRKRVEQALKDSEEQLRVIVETSEAGIILVSPQGRIRFANRRMAEMFGAQAQELVGTAYDDHVFEEERADGDRQMHRLIAGEVQSVSLERRYVGRDGGPFWGHLSGRRLENPDGTLEALVGVITDISARKRMEAEKLQIELQFQRAQKMESLGSLAGGVAHDMNNVLGAILGMASSNLDSQPEGSRAHRAFETIARAAVRGGHMVNRLLSFARQSPAEERELDLNAILREEVRLLERTTLAKVRLDLDLAEGLRPVRGDATALTHAFMNLCVNAVDAMPEQGTLTLRTRNVHEDEVEVVVADTGCGMTREVLDKALHPFFTTKEHGKGTGLGLSLVYSTVKAHHGQLDLDSEPGRGTRVRMRFPACAPAPAPGLETPEPALQAPFRALDVLLVDDDELVRSAMHDLLETLGHTTTTALNGEEALLRLEGGYQPDLVILDMNMPGLGGTGTLPRIRDLDPTVPILLATGRTDRAALELVEAYAQVTLLAKPFSMADLRGHLEALDGGPAPL
jgi:PAS domain S-box-containing protein